MKCRPSTGFSLVEVTLALGVAALSLLAIFGLLAAGSRVNHTAAEQATAAALLTAIAGDLRATPPATTTSLQFGIAIPANPVGTPSSTTLYFDSMGKSSTSLGSDSRYRIVLTFLPNGSGRVATLLDLRVTWPGAANPINMNTEAAETFLALDRN